MRLLILIAVVLASAGCQPIERDRLVARTTETYTLEALDPPKHVYADLLRHDGVRLKHVYVSKHCNRWRELKMGSVFALPTLVYERADGTRYAKVEARSVCPGH